MSSLTNTRFFARHKVNHIDQQHSWCKFRVGVRGENDGDRRQIPESSALQMSSDKRICEGEDFSAREGDRKELPPSGSEENGSLKVVSDGRPLRTKSGCRRLLSCAVSPVSPPCVSRGCDSVLRIPHSGTNKPQRHISFYFFILRSGNSRSM